VCSFLLNVECVESPSQRENRKDVSFFDKKVKQKKAEQPPIREKVFTRFFSHHLSREFLFCCCRLQRERGKEKEERVYVGAYFL